MHWEDKHIGRIADSHGFSHHQEGIELGIWGIPRTYILDCARRLLFFLLHLQKRGVDEIPTYPNIAR